MSVQRSVLHISKWTYGAIWEGGEDGETGWQRERVKVREAGRKRWARREEQDMKLVDREEERVKSLSIITG